MGARFGFGPRSFGPQPTPSAMALLELWRGGGAQHVALGAGCACCADGVVIQLADFEHDIADYLLAAAEREDRRDVVDFIQQEARRPNGSWSLERLLEALSQAKIPLELSEFLLLRLGRSLESFSGRHTLFPG